MRFPFTNAALRQLQELHVEVLVKKRGRRHVMSLDDLDAGVHNDPDFIEATTGGDPPLRLLQGRPLGAE